MPKFIRCVRVPEITVYQELVEAESLEACENEDYIFIKDLEPELTGEQNCKQGCGEQAPYFEEYEDED